MKELRDRSILSKTFFQKKRGKKKSLLEDIKKINKIKALKGEL